MPKRNVKLYLEDIVMAIDKIEHYVSGLSLVAFASDPKTVDAVVRNLEIIGEAVNQIPKSFLLKHPELPWKNMVEMRNKVIHEYFGIDEEILYQTVKEDLPKLKKQIKSIN